jgi:hypothetical protein
VRGRTVAAVIVLAVAGCADDHDASAPAGAAPERAPSAVQGAVGQFAVECPWSHSSFDDPIVHPGHAGASHRHDFFGNTGTTADSTYEALIGGDTTCRQRLDTASYWAPSMLDGEGRPVEPVSATAYYRVADGVDPTSVEAYPPGLMMVAGDPAAESAQPITVIAWTCGAGGRREIRPWQCPDPVGPRLLVTFPDCWDGVRLDSGDHRDHVIYSSDDRCPGSHPVALPQLQFAIDYPPLDVDGLSLASGGIESAHADFWNTWNQDKLDTEVELCLRQQHVCSLG